MKKRSKSKDLFGEGLSIGKVFLSKIADKITEGIEVKIFDLKKRIMQGIFSSILVGLGLLALLLSLYNYLLEILRVPKTQVYLYLGVLLLAIGFFLKYKLEREARRR